METTASNRKVRNLITGIRDGTLVPRPEFQRRLVWTTRDKRNFLDTVLGGYPFPEIYIAAGDVNLESGRGTELLVDGQQRITTLYQYFNGASDLRLGGGLKPYSELSENQKRDFLEYVVVVRDLGALEADQIREVFRRLNATNYALNDIEIHNAMFAGAFKQLGERVANHSIFENHRFFSTTEIRRMRDVRYVLLLVITIMSTYFHRDELLAPYLSEFNDEFDIGDELERELNQVFHFLESCGFEARSRVWKKADFFTVVVELHRLLYKQALELDKSRAASRLKEFYDWVDNGVPTTLEPITQVDVDAYARAALQATNDRSSRARRGEIIRRVLEGLSDADRSRLESAGPADPCR